MAEGFSLKIEVDNSEEILDELNNGMERALEAIGAQVENYAKMLCPVDTGNLRNSITHVVEPSEDAVYIGSAVEYAAYVEVGTSRSKAQPYLEPAVMDHTDEYEQIAKEQLSSE
jgi:HK97 gp10 family phage protein